MTRVPIRVFLAENEHLVRKGLRRLLELEPSIEIAGEAADGEEALRLIPGCAPDVVLVDLRMPKMSGLELVRALQARGSSPPCLILTTFDDDDAVLDTIRAGARGYLLKDVLLEELVLAITALAEGRELIQPALTERIRRGFSRTAPDAGVEQIHEPLTGRELEVLRLMFGGYNNREIVAACRVAERTIKTHVSSILVKLSVRDRTRAVLRALQLGLV